MARSDAIGMFWEDRPPEKKPKKEKLKKTPPPRTWEDESYLPHLEEALAFNVPVMNESECFFDIGTVVSSDIGVLVEHDHPGLHRGFQFLLSLRDYGVALSIH